MGITRFEYKEGGGSEFVVNVSDELSFVLSADVKAAVESSPGLKLPHGTDELVEKLQRELSRSIDIHIAQFATKVLHSLFESVELGGGK